MSQKNKISKQKPKTRLNRIYNIFKICKKYRLDQVIAESPFAPKIIRWLASKGNNNKSSVIALNMSRGERIRHILEELGPIFVKFGQLLSTRRDLIPLDIANELALLQDRVPPFESELAKQLIEENLKKTIEEVFDDFTIDPVASASIAQVHFATLKHNKKPVAVKVLRPNMQQVIEQDLSLMLLLAQLGEKYTLDGKRLKLVEVVGEFDKTLHDELDLMREAANASQLRRNFGIKTDLLVPEMYWDYCTENVIVMERMFGTPIAKKDILISQGLNIHQLAKKGVELFFMQVFRDGFFHADMHPGNIMVVTDKNSEHYGKYIALDFGVIGTLSDFDKNYLAQNFLAFFKRDYKQVAINHVASGWVPKNTRIDEFEAAIRSCCEPIFDRPLKEISFGNVLLRLFQTSRRFNVSIQPQLVLLQKTLLNIEGLGRELDPDLDLWDVGKPYLEKWMKEQVGLSGWWNQLKAEYPHWAKTLPQLPTLFFQQMTQFPLQMDLMQEHLQLLTMQQQKIQEQQNNYKKYQLIVSLSFLLLMLFFVLGVLGIIPIDAENNHFKELIRF